MCDMQVGLLKINDYMRVRLADIPTKGDPTGFTLKRMLPFKKYLKTADGHDRRNTKAYYGL